MRYNCYYLGLIKHGIVKNQMIILLVVTEYSAGLEFELIQRIIDISIFGKTKFEDYQQTSSPQSSLAKVQSRDRIS